MKQPAKYLLLTVNFLLFSLIIIAQDKLPVKFGKVTARDFDVISSLIDSGTNAVVVADVGKSEYVPNTNEGSLSLVFKHNKRIKIINKNGFEAATVSIYLYVSDDGTTEKLNDLNAITCNLENGKVVTTKVDKVSVFTEKKSKNWVVKKFTFPALKEGSIIEYSYEIKSDFLYNLQNWEFQGDYPVLWSQYEANIPEYYNFVILSQGYHPFLVNKNEQSSFSYSFIAHSYQGADQNNSNGMYRLNGSQDSHTWIMKDVPALKEEPYTTTINNSISKIEFQLKEVAYPNQLSKSHMNTWAKVSEEMMLHENFGALITRPNNWLYDDVAGIVKASKSPREKAKKIFEYIRDNYTCNEYNRYYVSTNLKDVVKNKSGSDADINMLLIAMLRTQSISADPVLLSTRSHGVTNGFYPLMDRYNYVIARVTFESDTIFLDATIPKLAFNKLPLKVYNGQARVIDKEATPVYFEADSVMEPNAVILFISNSDKGTLEGSYVNNIGYYNSLELRNKMAKSSLDDYTKKIQESYGDDYEIGNVRVDSLKILDEPVSLKYDIKLRSFGEADIVYFNPMLTESLKKNPFVAAERFYPVEMPYMFDEIYSLNMEIPKGYTVDEIPKSVRMMFNENEGMFEYLISSDGSTIQLKVRLLLMKANFTNEDYQSLRDFFAYIVKKEAEQIVFKKNK